MKQKVAVNEIQKKNVFKQNMSNFLDATHNTESNFMQS